MCFRRHFRENFLRFALLNTLGALCVFYFARESSSQVDRDRSREKLYDDLSRDVASLERQSRILTRVIKLVSPTVVHIESDKDESLFHTGARGYIEEAGSGVVIQIDGSFYVLTNRHVIKYATPKNIKIKLNDGRELNPTKIWDDGPTDIALMSISTPKLIPARLGNSDHAEIGDFVLAVGSPFGLSHSVTYGIISAKGRHDLHLGGEIVTFQNFIQTDAAINPGNSGGPLINLRGEVIGLNTAIASSSGGNEGIGFAIPVNMVLHVAEQLIENDGQVVRAFLGVKLKTHFTSTIATRVGLSKPQGALISSVIPGGPAERAQLQVDDVILNFDNKLVRDDNHLINLVALTKVGTEVPLEVLRDGKPLQIVVTVGNRKMLAPLE